jgi:hypothetical protein
MPAAPSAGAQPGALHSRTREWLPLYSLPSGFLSRRWGLPPPHPCLPLRSACLADSSLPRAANRLAGEGCRPHTPAFRVLGLSCRRLAAAGNEVFGRWGLPLQHPRFPLRSACLADGSLPRATNTAMTAVPSFSRRCTNEMAVEILASDGHSLKHAYTLY